jgi:hypothetical protein
MNELVVRKIELSFVPEQYVIQFEQEIVDKYIEIAQDKNYLLPDASDFMYSISPIYQGAGLVYAETGNPDELERLLLDHPGTLEELALEVFDDYTSDENIRFYQANDFEGQYHADIMNVLNYHRVCFVDTEYNAFSGERINWIMNNPLVTVW